MWSLKLFRTCNVIMSKRDNQHLTPVRNSSKKQLQLHNNGKESESGDESSDEIIAESIAPKMMTEGENLIDMSDEEVDKLRAILEDPRVRATDRSMLNEMYDGIKAIRTDIEKQKLEWNNKIDQVSNTINKALETKAAEIDSKLHEQNSRIVVIEDQLENVTNARIDSLETRLIDVEIGQRDKKLQICGLTEEENDDLSLVQLIVRFIKGHLGINFEQSDIVDAYRQGNEKIEGETRKVIMTLRSVGIRAVIMRNKYKLRKNGIPVFIDELLTRDMGLIYRRIRMLGNLNLRLSIRQRIRRILYVL